MFYKLATSAANCSLETGYSASPPTPQDLPTDNQFSVCIRLTDLAGNEAFGQSATITRDVVAPVFNSIDLAAEAIGGVILDSEKSATNDLVANLSATGHTTVTYRLAAATADCSVQSGFGASIPRAIDISSDGDYQVCVRLQDASGNEAFGGSASFTRDTLLPTFTSLDLAGAAADQVILSSEQLDNQPLAGNLVAPNAASASYKVTAAINDCSLETGYGAISSAADVSSDGSYKVCVKLLSSGGNVAYGSSLAFTRDTVVPTFTSIALANGASDGYISGAEAASGLLLVDSLSAAGHTEVAYKISGNGALCHLETGFGVTPPKISDVSADGLYMVCVRLRDSSGNEAYGNSSTVERDTVAPSFTSLDLMFEASDGIITAAEQAATSAVAGNLVATGYDSVSYKAVASAASCMSETGFGAMPQVTQVTSDGSYKVCAELSDASGNKAYGASSAFIRDTDAPVFTSMDLIGVAADGFLTGAESGDTGDLVGNLVANGQVSTQYKLVLAAANCALETGFGASIPTAADTGSDGTYKVCVELVDASGNRVVGASGSFVLDTLAPVFTSIDLANEAVGGVINDGEKAATNDLVANLTASGQTGVGYKLASSGADCSLETGYGASVPQAVNVSVDGSYKVCVRLYDAIGNESFGASAVFSRDTALPVFTSLDLIGVASDGFINDSEKLSNTGLVANLVATGFASASYKLTGAVNDCSLETGFGSIPAATGISVDGDYIVCVQLVSSVGNVAYGATSAFTRDIVSPSFTSIALANGASDGYISGAEAASGLLLVDSLSATGHTLVAYKIAANGADCSLETGYSGPVPKLVDVSSDGLYQVCVRLQDPAGNVVFGSSSVVTRDILAPTFTSLDLMNEASDGSITAAEQASTAVVSGNLVGAGYDSVSYKLASSAATCSSETGFGAMPQVAQVTSDGDYKVCVELSDLAGNKAYGASSGFTRDTGVPTFTSIDLLGVSLDGYLGSGEVSDTGPMVGNLVASGHTSIGYKLVLSAATCSLESGYGGGIPQAADTGSDATYKVCVELSDAVGNQVYGESAGIVRDTLAPTFTSVDLANEASDGYLNDSEKSAGNPLVDNLVGVGHSAATYKVVAPGVDCSLETGFLSVVPRASDILVDGAYKVCVRLSDLAGNTDDGESASFTRDVVLPTFASIDLLNVAADQHINGLEASDSLPLVGNLVGSGYGNVGYKVVASGSVCSGETGYGSMPDATQISVDGVYKVCVELSDSAGNKAYGSSAALTRDILGPSFTSIALVNQASDGFINDSEKGAGANLVGSLLATGYDSISFLIATPADICSLQSGYASAWPVVSDLVSDDTYKICIQLADDSGNEVFGESAGFVRDIVYPIFTSIDLINEVSDQFINDSEKNSSNDVAGGLVASGHTSQGYKWVASSADCSAQAGYSGLPMVSEVSSDGVYKLCVRLVDDAQNETFGASANFTRDTLAPVFTSIDLGAELSDGYVDDGEKSSGNALVTNLVGSGYASVEYQVALDGSSCSSQTGYAASLPVISSLLSDGTYIVCVKLFDSAGNSTFGSSASFIRDTEAPVFTSLPLAFAAADGYINDSEKNSTDALASPLSASGHTSQRYVLVGSPATCSAESGYGVTLPKINDVAVDGDYVVCVELLDLAGNVSYGSSPVVTRDIIAPTLTLSSSATIDPSNWSAYPVTGTCSEDGSVTVSGDGSGSGPCSGGNYSVGVDYSNADLIEIDITVGMVDLAGNAGVSSQSALIDRFLCTSTQLSQTANFSGLGAGTASDPYIICNVLLLQKMGDDLKAHYELGTHIDASVTSTWNTGISGTGFIPIGNLDDVSYASTPFMGSFHGNGYTIDSLTIMRPREGVGLFGAVGVAASISHVRLTNLNVKGQESVGGLVGHLIGSRVDDVYASGSVEGYSYYTGGIIGKMEYGRLANSVANVAVQGYDEYTGGITGGGYGGMTILNSESHGDVVMSNYSSFGSWDSVGGFIGVGYAAAIIGNTSTGDVFGGGHIGGFAGRIGSWGWSSLVLRNKATGHATVPMTSSTTTYAGGFAGYAMMGGNPNHALAYNIATGNASGYYSGGFAGSLWSGNDYSYADLPASRQNFSTGDVFDAYDSKYHGGFVGKFNSSVAGEPALSDSFATGNIFASGAVQSHGFAGIIENDNTLTNVRWYNSKTNCYYSSDSSAVGNSGCTKASGTSSFKSPSYSFFDSWDFTNNGSDGTQDTWKWNGDYPELAPIAEGSYVSSLSGSGTELDPYLITSLSDWNSIGDHRTMMSSHFKLTTDLDFSSTVPIPIGSNFHPFMGTFDGDGYVIRNLNADTDAKFNNGFFGPIVGATIKKIRFDNIAISNQNPDGWLDPGVVSPLCYGSDLYDIRVTNLAISMASDTSVGGSGVIHYGRNCYLERIQVEGFITTSTTRQGLLAGECGGCFIKDTYVEGSVYSGNTTGYTSPKISAFFCARGEFFEKRSYPLAQENALCPPAYVRLS